MTIVSYIAAAAATGFEHSLTRPTPRSPRAWVELCATAAAEAADRIRCDPPPVEDRAGTTLDTWLHEIENPGVPFPDAPKAMRGQELEAAALNAAGKAFRACMPMLVSKSATRAYIACVGAGTAAGFIDPAMSRSMMYTAQLALSAYKTRK